MGFFDFLKKEKKQESEVSDVGTVPVELELEKISEWININFSHKIENVKTRGRDTYDEIINIFSKMKKTINELDKSEFESRDKMYTPVNMIKKSFVSRTHSLINKIEKITYTEDYSFLDTFNSVLIEVLNDLKNIPPKQSFLISKYFKKQGNDIIKLIKEIETCSGFLKEFLGSDAKIILVSEKIESKIEEFMKLKDKMKSLERKENEIRNTIEETKKLKNQKREEIESMMNSDEWYEMSKIKENIKELNKKAIEIKQEIELDASKIKRALKKFDHELNQKEKKGLLMEMINNPFETFTERPTIVKQFLSELSELVKENKIILKGKEKEKIHEIIEKLDNEIPELKKKYDDLTNEKREKQESLKENSGILTKKEDRESNIEKLGQEIQKMELEFVDIAKSKKRTKDELRKHKTGIEETISETGKKVEIKGFSPPAE